MKRILICLLALILVFSFIGCSKINTMKRIKDTNKIVWGTNAAFAPFEMRQGDKVIGIDADIAQRIADKLGVELVVEDMEFEALMSALKSGKIDFIAAGFTVKPDRAEQVLFTDTYFTAVQVIMVTQDNEEIKGPDDLAGKKIGVQNATTGDFVASDIEDAEVERYNNGMEAVMDLKNGNIDAVIIDNLPAQLLAEKNPEVKILDEKPAENEEYALAVRKGDTELQKVINEVLSEMKASGEIEELVNKYSIGD
ncbi:MAG: basic amino acid ABC transporter substrate-binding protein [Clostridiales bacterium]|jgi:ABC-type amino acid transport substrate-binding protein|nr:basic amino acid ABC transporter substrate-binding protein [Clostridiales bacterium]